MPNNCSKNTEKSIASRIVGSLYPSPSICILKKSAFYIMTQWFFFNILTQCVIYGFHSWRWIKLCGWVCVCTQKLGHPQLIHVFSCRGYRCQGFICLSTGPALSRSSRILESWHRSLSIQGQSQKYLFKITRTKFTQAINIVKNIYWKGLGWGEGGWERWLFCPMLTD